MIKCKLVFRKVKSPLQNKLMKQHLLIKKNIGRICGSIFLSSIFFIVTTTVCLNPEYVCAQAGEWTWMKGCNTSGCLASWGTQGISSPTNTPEGVYAPYYWIDAQRNLWVMGGYGATGSYD